MRWKALAVLAAVAIAGCGGGGSDDTGTQSAQPPEQSSPPTTEPTKLTGKRTKAKVIKTLGYTKDGDFYTAPGGCKVTGISWDKKSTAALAKQADPPGNLVKNDSGTAGILLDKATYFCAIQAAHRLQQIP
jgi:hypothetical protein